MAMSLMSMLPFCPGDILKAPDNYEGYKKQDNTAQYHKQPLQKTLEKEQHVFEFVAMKSLPYFFFEMYL